MENGFFKSECLVLREVRYKEADRILTLYSKDFGKITAKARGALRKTSKTAAATQQLCYSEMTLFSNRDMISVNEANVIEPFDALKGDISALALGCYFAECIEALAQEGETEPAILQLGLNSLYALSRGLKSQSMIKAAFELRLMCITGFAPELSGCAVCGKEKPEEPVLGLESGRICCRTCRSFSIGITDYLDDAALEAMRHISAAPAKSFIPGELPEDSLKKLEAACEDYLSKQAERKFGSLEYWKNVR